MGDPSRTHEAVAVPALQPAVHHRVPDDAARADHAAGRDRAAASCSAERVGPRVRRDLPGTAHRRDRRRPAAVGFPSAQEAGGRHARPRLRHRRAFPPQPAPQLLLRAEPMVGVLRDRSDGCGRLGCRLPRRRAELDGDRAVPAQHPVHRIDDLHRVDHRGQVSCVRRIPPDDVDARPLAAADPTSRRVRGPTVPRVSAPPRRLQSA